MSTVISLPPRSEVKIEDTWDLSPLFTSNDEWEATLKQLEDRIDGYADFRGKLGESAVQLAACLRYDSETERLAEGLANYFITKYSTKIKRRVINKKYHDLIEQMYQSAQRQ